MRALTGSEVKGYRLEERIGVGGFGVVYRAVQASVGRDVAIKLVLPNLANEPEFVRRFEFEAQLVARLEHPHITPLYDYWRDPEGAYLVMRYYPRGSLRDALKQGAYELEDAAVLLDQIASALEHAHANGVVHRDIKPSNVLLDEVGRAYLTDFGIAKSVAAASQSEEGLTAPGAVIGSPDYLAPEQARGQAIAPSADIYSLGVLMHEVLRGNHPFPDSTPVERMVKHLNESVPDVDGLPESVAEDVNAVLRMATAKSPGERFGSAAEMARAFWDALRPHLRATGRDVPTSEKRAPTMAAARRGPVENPFKGLRAFRAADADDFYGREALVQDLTARMAEASDARFLALVGPSGSGKSSVMHAGLIPAIRDGAIPGSEDWFVVDMVPGSHPFDELEVALTRVAIRSSPTLRDHLTRDERGLVRAAQIVLPDDQSDLLIVIDQFEELFTLVEDDASRRKFLSLIHTAATDPRSRVRFLVTLRADFFDRPLQYPGFAEMLRDRVETIVPLSAEELERAIVAPAQQAGLRFEQGLVTRIINEVHEQPGALPLMQYALMQLYETREDRTLTRAAFERLGGVGGALANKADELFQQQDARARDVTRQMFLRLVALGEGTEDTRRRVLRSELRSVALDTGVMDAAIERFATHRLLSLDHDPATREPTVELAHEAILREWSRLGRWLDDSRNDIRMQRQLGSLAEEWRNAGEDPSFLLRGTRLAQHEAWRDETDVALTPHEQAFLNASLELRDREAAEEQARQERAAMLQRRSQRFLQALVGVLLVAAVVSGGLGLWANQQRLTAEEQRQAAEAERTRAATAEHEAREQAGILLAAQAESEAEEGNTDLAILLALEALANFPPVPQSERALANAVIRNHALQDFHGHDLGLTSAAWSPDGTLVASSSQFASTLVWDPTTGEQVAELTNPDGFVRNVFDYPLSVRWSPDGASLYGITGDRFTTGGQDFNLIRWDVATQERLAFVQIPNAAEPEEGVGNSASAFVYPTGDALDVAPRSGRVASLAGDDTAAVWSPDLSERLFTLTGHADDVMSVIWSPDERYLATAGYDGTVRIWAGTDGRVLQVLEGHVGAVRTAAWSPDGIHLATAGSDGTVRIWVAGTGEGVQTIDVPAAGVRSLVWPPEGRNLVVSLQDNDVYLANLDTGELEATLSGHRRDVIDLALAPDGQRFVSASRDGSARVWSTLPATTVYTFPYASQGEAGWSPDGSLLAIPTNSFVQGVDFTGVVSLWDAETRKMHDENLEDTPFNLFFESTFSPDGSMIFARALTSWPDGFQAGEGAIVLDAETGEMITEVRSSDGTFLREGDWSPDGRHVAIASIEGLIEIVDTSTWEPVRSFVHGDSAFVNMVNYSPGGEILSSVGADGQVRLWDPDTGAEIRAFGPEPASEIWTAAWSPDGERLVTNTGGAEGSIGTFGYSHVWDPDTGEELVRFDGHEGDLIGVSWSPDGTRVVSIGTDDFARVWDAQTGHEIASIPTHVEFGAPAMWSPNGGLIMVGSDGRPAAKVVEFWQTTQELIEYTRDCCVFRELTDAEREEFALDVAVGP